MEVSITIFGNLLCALGVPDLALGEDLVISHVGAFVALLVLCGCSVDVVRHGGCRRCRGLRVLTVQVSGPEVSR
ncbi:hypothetical protein C7974DRAFT_397194 [Boeremia exigua]|uniref:uncharacterized protein n=1 Tax=Boeremia exigua TaxID=749465 RepID=UPI001E8E7658|nr:uncharacterized protein C7974DRAFT_397194 [Boeremia exigua]KAH6621818.1 hypothetical protein C7974DRAFT_397194 [Boeremia exigua]